MALRASRNNLSLRRVQILCRLLSSKFDHSPNNRDSYDEQENMEPRPRMDHLSGNFRYKVCSGRSSPVERPTISNIIESQCKANIEMHHLQPSMLPTFQHKNLADSAGIKVQKTEKKKHVESLVGLQASKTYSNVQLPLKSVKLAPPFPEPVKIMNSCKIPDDEKAEMMLKEAKSLKLQANLHTQARRSYSSMASYPQDRREQTKKSASTALLVSRLSPTHQVFIKASGLKKNFSSIKPKIVRAPAGPNQHFFFSQHHQPGQAVTNPHIITLPQQSPVSKVLNDINVEKHQTSPRYSRNLSTVPPKKGVFYKTKRTDSTRSFSSVKSKKKLKVEKEEKVKDPKGAKTVLSTFQLRDQIPSADPQEMIKAMKKPAPYPAYSEFCHQDVEEMSTQSTNFQRFKTSSDFKQKTIENRTSSTLEKFGKTLAPASSIIGMGAKNKPEELEFAEDKQYTPKEKSLRASWNKITDYISNKSQLILEDQIEHYFSNRDKERKAPKCKKFPFRPPPKEEDPTQCPKPPKKKLIKDCPDAGKGACIPPPDCDAKPYMPQPRIARQLPAAYPVILNTAAKKNQLNFDESNNTDDKVEKKERSVKSPRRNKNKFRPKMDDPWGFKSSSRTCTEDMVVKKANKSQRKNATF